jgi:hypothetical protein
VGAGDGTLDLAPFPTTPTAGAVLGASLLRTGAATETVGAVSAGALEADDPEDDGELGVLGVLGAAGRSGAAAAATGGAGVAAWVPLGARPRASNFPFNPRS